MLCGGLGGQVGKSGSRSFVVQWNNVYFSNNTAADGSLTFQIRLNEKDGTIDLLYKTVTPGSGRESRPGEATIAVEDEDGTGRVARHPYQLRPLQRGHGYASRPDPDRWEERLLNQSE